MFKRKAISCVVLAMVLIVGSTIAGYGRALAFDTSSSNYINGLYYNALVNNSDFIAINSMSAADVQSFLTAQGGYLASAPSSQLGDRAAGRSAAQIISDAAHGAGEASGTLNGVVIDTGTGSISPRALLVTLQKEQSLVTRTDYNQNALDKAMGYGCPDGGSCNPTYAGFTNQVEWAAWQLRYNYEIAGKDISWWNSHYTTVYYTGYSRSHNWGSTYYVVTYSNQATAALYRYTPHVGYGNYNFWRLMIDWFGVGTGNGGGGSLAINDTESISLTTYRDVIKVAGTKDTSSRAYLNGGLIADLSATTWSGQFTATVGVADYWVSYRNADGTEIATKKITVDRRKVGDVNGDVKVDLLDISLMSDAWGLTVKDDAWLNLNPDTDNVVDLLDLSLLANSFEG